MTVPVASTSLSPAAASGSARKRVRTKRNRKRKSTSNNTTNGQNDTDSSSDEEVSAPALTPASAAAPIATISKSKAPPAKVAKTTAAGPSRVKATTTSSSAGLETVNPHKPSFITRPATSRGRKFTISVAIPGSIVLNAQSPELQSRLAAHIARACAIFNVDEIVVFDEGEVRTETSDPYQHRHNRQDRGTKRGRFGEPQGHSNPYHNQQQQSQREAQGAEGYDESCAGDEGEVGEGGTLKGGRGGFDPHAFLARVLQYLETPQYLRKALFPMHRDLRLAGLMPPLDCPHHLRFEDQSEYREGVTQEPPHWAHRNRSNNNSVYVNVGLRDPIEAPLPAGAPHLESGTRVTIRMPLNNYDTGAIVSPREPVENLGWYWGYTVRLAACLSSVLTSCPFSPEGAYDLVVGTSERGVSLTDLALATSNNTRVATQQGETVQPLGKFSNALIVFGGLSGLEVAVEQDEGIKLDRNSAKELFDAWVNVVENQGSRTVRTEEAIMIALARLKPILEDVALSK
ncbi:uncharacterized protein MEPE_06261 [Melanopsichium pennsylvanicum]|uniref:DUF171-domain-containing protein n=2 Tax=Melanopsichium pennsylvanicum TaxID=63383 RepID=A0AAJ4XT58_9BASI|nr:conserved hypothetical protein [Melanopsichium pennsylvanicum 4]SNX87551.1 uncharacterized protein MEPE_06261 [Melanopsichium pennsylvanicum]